jgi:hypothetical protein
LDHPDGISILRGGAMNRLLLDQFLAEERSPYAYGLLNSALKAVKAETAPAKKQFEFNRF